MKTIKKIIFEEVLTSLDLSEVDKIQYSQIKEDDIVVMTNSEQIRTPFNIGQKTDRKPNGLWYGIGTQWIDWVRYEMPEWEKPNVFILELNNSKIITVDDDTSEFEREYVIGSDFLPKIDWNKVKRSYSGVEVRYGALGENYFWGWDIESGCIWNSDAIINIKKI